MGCALADLHSDFGIRFKRKGREANESLVLCLVKDEQKPKGQGLTHNSVNDFVFD